MFHWPGNSLQALSNAIQSKSLTVVVGSGGTMFSRPHRNGEEDLTAGSWYRLLQSGLDMLASRRLLAPALQQHYQGLMDAGDTVDLLNVASKVESCLRSRNLFGAWLTATFGGLTPSDVRLYRLLGMLQEAGARIVTTNYDCLIEDHLHIQSMSYGHQQQMQQWIARTPKGVLHIHGCYLEPASVILNSMSYERIIANEPLRRLLHGVVDLTTVLFVGVGAGITDPHMRALMPPQQQPIGLPRHYAIVPQDAAHHFDHDDIVQLVYSQGEHESVISALCGMMNFAEFTTNVEFRNLKDSRDIPIVGNNGVIVLHQAGLDVPGVFTVSLLGREGQTVGDVKTIDPNHPVPPISWNNLREGTYKIRWAARQQARHFVETVRVTSS